MLKCNINPTKKACDMQSNTQHFPNSPPLDELSTSGGSNDTWAVLGEGDHRRTGGSTSVGGSSLSHNGPCHGAHDGEQVHSSSGHHASLPAVMRAHLSGSAPPDQGRGSSGETVRTAPRRYTCCVRHNMRRRATTPPAGSSLQHQHPAWTGSCNVKYK